MYFKIAILSLKKLLKTFNYTKKTFEKQYLYLQKKMGKKIVSQPSNSLFANVVSCMQNSYITFIFIILICTHNNTGEMRMFQTYSLLAEGSST